MKELQFEWDEKKEKINIKKHGVSFEESRTVFYDENAIQFFDPDHADDEDRFILLGMSFKLRVLIVCHCYPNKSDVVALFAYVPLSVPLRVGLSRLILVFSDYG